MKTSVLLAVSSAVIMVLSSSCKEDDADSGSPTANGGALEAPADVECTHPGAGKPIDGTDRCACSTTRNVAGEWAAMRTCREGDACPAKNKEDAVVIEQKGTRVTLTRGDNYSITGVLCGDALVWSGGSKDGLNPECGVMRFSDDAHYLTDSCYAASGACERNYGAGCTGQKGQCTGTGTKRPDPATPIQKVICLK